MRFSIFVIQKLLAHKAEGRSFSRLILRLSVAATAISVAVMIIASALVDGFQIAVGEKIFGFWGHILITDIGTTEATEVVPMSIDQPFYPNLKDVGPIQYATTSGMTGAPAQFAQTKGGVRHIQPFVNKEGVIKTKTQMEGIILRGINIDFDWNYLSKYITQGKPLQLKKDSLSEEILISEVTAKRLEVKVGDRFQVFFVKDGQQLQRRLTICGLFRTGLEEYDLRFALVDMRQLQKLNNWRPYKHYEELVVQSDSILNLSQPKVTRVKLPNLFGPGDMGLPMSQITSMYPTDELGMLQQRLVAGQLPNPTGEYVKGLVLPSTFSESTGLTIRLGDTLKMLIKDGEDAGSKKWVQTSVIGFYTPLEGGSPICFADYRFLDELNQQLSQQVGGFEVAIEHIEDLDAFGEHIRSEWTTPFQYTQTMKEMYGHIFSWLELQDKNEQLILLLMGIVAIINMVTALLILIIERTQMVGLMKAMGATNWQVRWIFVLQAAYILLWGLFFGNLLGLGICWVQGTFGLLTLPEDMYYVSVAPIHIQWSTILGLNIGTFIITILVLILPTWLVSRISPVKAIRWG